MGGDIAWDRKEAVVGLYVCSECWYVIHHLYMAAKRFGWEGGGRGAVTANGLTIPVHEIRIDPSGIVWSISSVAEG
jgi:hypothetical protein